jgi:hypothetical protein
METKRPESRVVWAFVRDTLAGGPGGELPSSAVGRGPTCQWRRHRTYVSALRIATRTPPLPLTRTPPLFLLRRVFILVRPPRRAAHWRSPWTPPSASSFAPLRNCPWIAFSAISQRALCRSSAGTRTCREARRRRPAAPPTPPRGTPCRTRSASAARYSSPALPLRRCAGPNLRNLGFLLRAVSAQSDAAAVVYV